MLNVAIALVWCDAFVWYETKTWIKVLSDLRFSDSQFVDCSRPSLTISNNLRSAETKEQLTKYMIGLHKSQLVQQIVVPQDVLGVIVGFLQGNMYVYTKLFYMLYVYSYSTIIQFLARLRCVIVFDDYGI